MDTISLFEQLANMTHHNKNTSQIINLLPNEVKNAFIADDSQQLRKTLSGQDSFYDSKTVTSG
jgi:hypothetical protein